VACEQPVDPANIKANLLTIIAEADHITPPCMSKTIVDRVGSKDKTLHYIHGGHIGIMVGSSANRVTWPYMNDWLAPRSQ
jgi:polyhydroxyalkanoate synthase